MSEDRNGYSAGSAGGGTSLDGMTYKEATARLQELVDRIESGEADVDELGAIVTEATALTTLCRKKLRNTQSTVEVALAGLNGEIGSEAVAMPAPLTAPVPATASGVTRTSSPMNDLDETDPFADE